MLASVLSSTVTYPVFEKKSSTFRDLWEQHNVKRHRKIDKQSLWSMELQTVNLRKDLKECYGKRSF